MSGRATNVDEWGADRVTGRLVCDDCALTFPDRPEYARSLPEHGCAERSARLGAAERAEAGARPGDETPSTPSTADRLPGSPS